MTNALTKLASMRRPIGEARAISTAIGGLLAIATAIGIGRFVYTPILPPMIEALGLSKAQAGLIASANFLGYLIGALLAAMPTLPGSRRFWVLAALTVSALTTTAMGLSEAMTAFLALRFAGGAASAFVLIITSTWCWSDWRKPDAAAFRRCISPAWGAVLPYLRRWSQRCCDLASLGRSCGSRVARSQA